MEDHEDALVVFERIEPAADSGRGPDSDNGAPPSSDSHGHRAPPERESQRGHATQVFASQVADVLRKHRNAHRYDELVLVAAPRFLGALRHALDAATAATVRGTLDKDYGNLEDRVLLERLNRL